MNCTTPGQTVYTLYVFIVFGYVALHSLTKQRNYGMLK